MAVRFGFMNLDLSHRRNKVISNLNCFVINYIYIYLVYILK